MTAARLLVLVLFVAAWLGGAQALEPWQTLPTPRDPPGAASAGTVPNGDNPIFYAEYGKGPAVVLLHGGLGHADQWALQIPELSTSFRVIALDSRGHGRSGWDGNAFGYHMMAADVLSVLDHLGVGQAVFIGWSDGGNIALDIAVNNPERVKGLFVYGANFHPSGMKSPPAGNRVFARYLQRATTDYQRLSGNSNDLGKLLQALRRMWRTQPRFSPGDLASIAVPVVVAHGEHDEIVRAEHSRSMARAIPGARLVVLKRVSHFAMWQDATAFNAALLGFLADIGYSDR